MKYSTFYPAWAGLSSQNKYQKSCMHLLIRWAVGGGGASVEEGGKGAVKVNRIGGFWKPKL